MFQLPSSRAIFVAALFAGLHLPQLSAKKVDNYSFLPRYCHLIIWQLLYHFLIFMSSATIYWEGLAH